MVDVEQTEPNLLDRADISAERLEKALKANEEILKKMEAIESRRVLGGQTTAGQTPPVVEETPQEYAKRIMSGKL